MKLENKENLPGITETISAEDLYKLIWKGEHLPQDNRFLPIEKGGVFRYFDPRDVLENIERKYYSLIKVGDKVIGLSELEKAPETENTIWLKFLSIDKDYQGQGYASKLAEEIFIFTKKEGFILEGSSYSDEGYEKLKSVLNRLANKYSVEFIDKGKLN